MKRVSLMTALLVFSMSAVALADYDNVPDGMKGFSGQVRGVVVAKDEKGFVLKIAKILKLWDGNKAENPESGIGKKLLVTPRWQQGDDGKWYRNDLHVAFIKKLEVGDEITIELRHVEGNALQILELSEEQRQLARAEGDGEGEKKGDKEGEKEGKKDAQKEGDKEKGEKAELPEKGVVVGEITQLKDLSFKLKVIEAGKGCEALANETMEFLVRWIQKEGKWIPDPKEVKVFGQLRLGDRVKVEFCRDEHWRVNKIQVLKRAEEKRVEELKKKQREAEELEKKEREKKAAAEEQAREKKEREEAEKHEKEGKEHEAEELKKKQENEEHEKKEQEKKSDSEKPKNWPVEGSIYGVVTSIGSTTLSVKVLKASDNARMMVGETVTFYVNWIQTGEGKWIPDPEEVALIKSLKLEDKVEIRFYFEEHYRIRKLEKQ
jgi:hypothetical protein